MIKRIEKNKIRLRKHLRVRKKISGTAEKPRLSVFRSSRHIYAQIIDDVSSTTLVAASSLDEALKGKLDYSGNKQDAREVGKLIGTKAIDKGIKQVVFDRGGYLYHGRVKELADGAREAGLEF
ncbi:MAG: 50S ribosomal protein L18 [Clostridiaceae bacterium]|nr:50S ribosomal protein L18 [Clostridiaceae bacterium]